MLTYRQSRVSPQPPIGTIIWKVMTLTHLTQQNNTEKHQAMRGVSLTFDDCEVSRIIVHCLEMRREHYGEKGRHSELLLVLLNPHSSYCCCSQWPHPSLASAPTEKPHTEQHHSEY